MAQLMPVSFASPYTADEERIERQQRLAQYLQQQADQPLPQGNMVSGWYVPSSPLHGLAAGLRGYGARKFEREAEEERRRLEERKAADLQTTMGRYGEAMMGTPARWDEDAAGNAWQTGAKAADPMAAAQVLMGNPMTAPMGMQQIQQQAQRQALLAALRGQGMTQPQQPGMQMPGAAGATPPINPQQSGGMGGPAGGMPLEAWLQVDPSGKSYMEQLAKESAPIVQREGGVYRMVGGQPQMMIAPRPQGVPGVQYQYGQGGVATGASEVPGFSQSVANIEGAKAGAESTARAPFQPPIMLPGPGGSQEAVPVPEWAARNTPRPQLPPITGARSDYNAALQEGIAATERGQPFTVSVPSITPGPRRTQTTQERSESDVVGRQLGEYYGKTMGDASSAAVANRYLDNMELAVRDFTPGKLTPLKSTLTQWAQAARLPVSEREMQAAGSIQALTSMAIKMAGTATRQSDAQPSQLQYFKILESMPNEQRTPEGFSRIVAYMRDANNYSIAKAQHLEEWRRSHGGSSEGFEAQWPKIADTLPFVWNQQILGPIPKTPARPTPADQGFVLPAGVTVRKIR